MYVFSVVAIFGYILVGLSVEHLLYKKGITDTVYAAS